MTSSLLLTLAVVLGISAGQVLFKYGADALGSGFDALALARNPFILAAVVLYGGCTVLWVYVLTNAELSKVYPLVSLTFVFVPLAGYFLFEESIGTSYIAGVGFILLGLVLITR